MFEFCGHLVEIGNYVRWMGMSVGVLSHKICRARSFSDFIVAYLTKYVELDHLVILL